MQLIFNHFVQTFSQTKVIFLTTIGVIEGIATSSEGALFCSVGDDKAMKVFDVVNFDMINMLKLG